MSPDLKEKRNISDIKTLPSQQSWPWWPLLPLYPYGKRRTVFKELIPSQLWSFEQLQGIYYVAVPVRMTVVRVNTGLMLINPLPPTKEILNDLKKLQDKYGPVKTIVLPTASGLEHKISLPALARSFPSSILWICPGQWSFPIPLPLDFLGIPRSRTNILFADGLPHKNCCDWFSLGPVDIGLGRFQEISCFHRVSKALIVTDALVGIDSEPPSLFDLDPTPLLFHSRDKGSDPLIDTPSARRKGWSRVVLFSSFLRPSELEIPPLSIVLNNAFKPGLRNFRSHFGLFPFDWKNGWEKTAKELMGYKQPIIQIAPVIERLVFPRAKDTFIDWLDDIKSIKGLNWLVSAHFNALVRFTNSDVQTLKNKINNRSWARNDGNWTFISSVDKTLLKLGVVPKKPVEKFRD